jgi:hypothetical protein
VLEIAGQQACPALIAGTAVLIGQDALNGLRVPALSSVGSF